MRQEIKNKYDRACAYSQQQYDKLLEYRQQNAFLSKWLEERKLTRTTKNVICTKLVEVLRMIEDMQSRYQKLFNMYNAAMYHFKRPRNPEQHAEYNMYYNSALYFINYIDETFPEYMD